MDGVFAKIAESTVKFNLGDEEVTATHAASSFSFYWPKSLFQEWRKIYEPLYEAPSKDVGVIKDERYRPAERNRLDLFFPLDKSADKPVLLFVHGGGFFSGDKGWSEKVCISIKFWSCHWWLLKCWANIGNFFARHGIVTVVATHQLVPHVQYPGGADDIQLAREWICKNISSEKFGKGSVNKVILFGHSRSANFSVLANGGGCLLERIQC
jgi:prenylcysteine alpha-carboxyl methylesterase